MPHRSDVPPDTVGVDLVSEGVVVEYLDGRNTLYRGAPTKKSGTLRTGPGKETHVLVTDPTESEGVMLYVNDLKTHDDILEDSGVGRVILEEGESEEIFPGVTVRRIRGERTEVEADPEEAGGRVFVFVEDDWGERSFELVGGDTREETDADTPEGSVEPDADPVSPADDAVDR